MSLRKTLSNPAMKSNKDVELNEEWSNFTQRIGQVHQLVKDLASGDKKKSDAAKILADQYLEGKMILDDNIKLTVKSDRTVINKKAFKNMGKKDSGEMDKDTFMAEMTKDAEQRSLDRKIRREKADTLKNQAMRAFRRKEYNKALSYYNRAMEQVKDDAMLLCDRALTNIKLGNYEKVFDDCHWALRLNENSFKARLYTARAHKELEQWDKLEVCRKELEEKFPQHMDIITYFIDQKNEVAEEEEETSDTIQFN